MTDAADHNSLPSARVVRRRWPGLVWAVPIAALLVVVYLGVRALANSGTNVVVTFQSAAGVSPGDTKVVENGVEVGRVTEVRIAHDARHVELTLHLDERVKPALTDTARFWMIGANPSITDLQSVKAAIAGVSIGFEPGQPGASKRKFEGLGQTPLIPFGAKGRRYFLVAKALGGIARGASIKYHGQEIGKVVGTQLDGLDRFRLGIWISAPYDQFVRDGAQFWTASPLKVKLVAGGFSTQLAPASVFQGSIQFDLPEDERANRLLPPDSTFELFDDQTSAEQGRPGPEVRYALTLHGEAGDLDKGAPIMLLGYQVGEVLSARLLFAGDGRPYTAATVAIYPHKLDVPVDATSTPATLRATTDAAVSRLLRVGYRAKLNQSPPFIGAHSIALVRDRKAGPGALDYVHNPYPTIPVSEAGSGDLDDILGKVDQILTKVNKIPLEQIGQNVQALTANVRDITAEAKPKVGPLMDKLNATATQLEAVAGAARTTLSGEGANQGEGLPQTVRQLNEAAQSLRALTDYLGRHPEALLRGKGKEKAK